MKILYIVTRGDVIGGASMHVLELATEMQRRQVDVTVLLGPGEVVARLAEQRGLPVIVEPSLRREIAPLADLRCLLRLYRLMRQLKPDLVHLHSAKAGILGRLVAKSLSIPVVYSVHGWAFSMFSGRRARWYQRLERWLLPFTDLLVLVCRRDLALAKQLAASRQVRLELVYNGIADNHLQSGGQHSPLVRLISVARFEAPKDPQTLLQSLVHLPATGWQLTFVGSGPMQAQCEALAAELGLSQVIFAGERDDVPLLLQQSDIFVLCSHSESLPISVLEAMRAGLPVIATEVGGMAELVDDSRSGYLVPAANSAVLADRLLQLIHDAQLRTRMGLAAREHFCRHFVLEQQCDQLSALYQQLAEAV